MILCRGRRRRRGGIGLAGKPLQVPLRRWVTLIGGELIPMHGLRVILHTASATLIAEAQAVLRRGVTLIGGELIPMRGLRVILHTASAIRIAGAQVYALLGRREWLFVLSW